MADLRSFEEYCLGVDGDEEGSLLERTNEVFERVKQDKISEVIVSVYYTPMGGTAHSDEGYRAPGNSDPSTVVTSLMHQMKRSVGEGFVGSIRINFGAKNPTRHLGSYFRKMAPVNIDDGQTAGESMDARMEAYIVRVENSLQAREASFLRAQDATCQLSLAMANMCKGIAEVLRPQSIGDSRQGPSGLPMLLGVLGKAIEAAKDAPAGKLPIKAAMAGAGEAMQQMAQNSGGGQQESSSESNASSSSDEPLATPGRIMPDVTPLAPPITRKDVEQWGEENPEEAEAMVMEKMRKKGLIP